ncbi:MAG: type II secretion system protein [Nitrospirota bacterium]
MKLIRKKIIPPFPPLLKGGRGDYGITLIELIVAISVVGILVAALAFEFEGWMSSYKVESQIKEMYVDLMNAKARAMQKNRVHFVTLTTTQYTIYEDTNTAPDGNGNLETASDTMVLRKNLSPNRPVTWSNLGDTQIDFTKRGLSNDDKTICSNTTIDTDYNCIELSASRINLGKLTTKIPAPYGGTCDSTNCVSR